ncbi:YetF domain-containing protein [Rhodoglobus sp. NPDC076762]
MWFDSWPDLLRIAVVGAAGYATLLIVLRISGKRTLAQLNVFDFVVTVALGSIFATLLLNTNVSWSEGVAAFAVIATLQFVVAGVASRWPTARKLVTSSPILLLHDGEMRHDALRRSRLTESEVRQAIRESGAGDVSGVSSVVLETNGKLSVIPRDKYGDGSALADVKR